MPCMDFIAALLDGTTCSKGRATGAQLQYTPHAWHVLAVAIWCVTFYVDIHREMASAGIFCHTFYTTACGLRRQCGRPFLYLAASNCVVPMLAEADIALPVFGHSRCTHVTMLSWVQQCVHGCARSARKSVIIALTKFPCWNVGSRNVSCSTTIYHIVAEWHVAMRLSSDFSSPWT